MTLRTSASPSSRSGNGNAVTKGPLNKCNSLCQAVLPVLLLCALTNGSRAQDQVQALRYGVTLFHFYQQDYFDALTELMAAQQLERLDVHAQEAELLRGGMSLSYGMDRVAQGIFQGLLEDAGDRIDRDQAWFYLGKMAWQRGEAQRAEEALGQLSAGYNGELAPEADYLRASIAQRLGDDTAAASFTERLPPDSSWRYYLYYNLGAALAEKSQWLPSVAYFSRFEQMSASSEETRALRDRAFTAGGFANMAAGNYERARMDFSQVRLNGPFSDRALLGYGWASSEQGDYQAALSPWETLSEKSMLDASARESLLAIPYAYEKLDRPGIALDKYSYASQTYSSELIQLRAALAAFRTAELASLLGVEHDSAGEWLFEADIFPQGHYAPYLQYLVSGHQFQIALRELRDLYNIAGRLDTARQRLQVLRQVDLHQQTTWSTVLEGEEREELGQRQALLRSKIADMRQRLDRAVLEGDTQALANTQQLARWNRLEQAENRAAAIGTEPAQREKLRLLRGLLIWEDNESFPDRVWRLQREMTRLESLAAESDTGLRNVDRAIAQRQQSSFESRITALEQRVERQAMGVEHAIARSEQGVRQLAVTELERQVAQLSRTLGQSRLAIARLYDQGSQEVVR